MRMSVGKYSHLQLEFMDGKGCYNISDNLNLVKGIYSRVEQKDSAYYMDIIFDEKIFDVDDMIDLIENLDDELLLELDSHGMLKQFDEDGYDEEGHFYGVDFKVLLKKNNIIPFKR